jgi:murein DD-endopeptidase MepM/ murein hydrolase activator NlpD
MRPAARRLRRLAWTLLWLAALGVLLVWAWGRPFMAAARMTWDVSRASPPTSLPVPVQGVRARQIADTFGAPRGRDRTHQGVDIFAKRGTPITSATRGVVVSVRDGGLGGKQVWVLGPGRERHYYAHLDDWAADLSTGQVVHAGDVLGFVGTTGNAQGTPPHLHYGISGMDGAYDPLPLFRASPSISKSTTTTAN